METKKPDKNNTEGLEMRGEHYLEQFLFDCNLKNLSGRSIDSYRMILSTFIRWTEREKIPTNTIPNPTCLSHTFIS